MGNTDKFERIADSYDTSERIKMAKISSNTIRDYLVDTKSKDAIDFGCGTGLIGMNLINDFRSMLFLDASTNMINQIKQKLACSNAKNADTLCFDVEKGEKLNLHADYIFMTQVLLHIKDVNVILSLLYEVLNENGHLIIIDFDKNDNIISDLVHNGFNQPELAGIMNQIGYKNVKSETFYSGKKLFMGYDASLFILDSQK